MHGGFSGPGPSLFNPPTASNLWIVGRNIHSGTILNYSLTKIGNHSSPWIFNYLSKENTVLLSKQQLTNAGPISQDFTPYYEPIESSILEIRDIALQQEYLVVGAEWNSITLNVATVHVKVIAQEKIQTNAGSFDTFVLADCLRFYT